MLKTRVTKLCDKRVSHMLYFSITFCQKLFMLDVGI